MREALLGVYVAPTKVQLQRAIQQKCPICGHKSRYQEALRYSGHGVQNCNNETYYILSCTNCGFRMHYDFSERKVELSTLPVLEQESPALFLEESGSRIASSGRSSLKILLISLLLIILVGGFVGFGIRQKQISAQAKSQNIFEDGLLAYKESRWEDAFALFESGASDSIDAQVMLAWCQLMGIGCTPDEKAADEQIKNIPEMDSPYYWAIKGNQAWFESQKLTDNKSRAELITCALQFFEKSIRIQTFEDTHLQNRVIEVCRSANTKQAHALEFYVLQQILKSLYPPETITELSSQTREALQGYLNNNSDFKTISDTECATNMFSLGNYYWRLLEDEQALRWWYAAALNGSTDAMCQIGRLYYYGGDVYRSAYVSKSPDLALLYAQAAQKAGDSNGMVLSAQILSKSEPDTSKDLLDKAMEKENGIAACLIGDLQPSGLLKGDYYLTAYDRYHCADGYQRFGQSYLDGTSGRGIDKSKGWSYLRKAADEGSTLAQISCSINYYYAHYLQLNSAEDYEKGFYYLKEAAVKRDEHYSTIYELISAKYQITWDNYCRAEILGENDLIE